HFPTELLIGHNERDKRVSDLYRVNVVTGASARIETNDGAFVWYYTDAQRRAPRAGRRRHGGLHGARARSSYLAPVRRTDHVHAPSLAGARSRVRRRL